MIRRIALLGIISMSNLICCGGSLPIVTFTQRNEQKRIGFMPVASLVGFIANFGLSTYASQPDALKIPGLQDSRARFAAATLCGVAASSVCNANAKETRGEKISYTESFKDDVQNSSLWRRAGLGAALGEAVAGWHIGRIRAVEKAAQERQDAMQEQLRDGRKKLRSLQQELLRQRELAQMGAEDGRAQMEIALCQQKEALIKKSLGCLEQLEASARNGIYEDFEYNACSIEEIKKGLISMHFTLLDQKQEMLAAQDDARTAVISLGIRESEIRMLNRNHALRQEQTRQVNRKAFGQERINHITELEASERNVVSLEAELDLQRSLLNRAQSAIDDSLLALAAKEIQLAFLQQSLDDTQKEVSSLLTNQDLSEAVLAQSKEHRLQSEKQIAGLQRQLGVAREQRDNLNNQVRGLQNALSRQGASPSTPLITKNVELQKQLKETQALLEKQQKDAVSFRFKLEQRIQADADARNCAPIQKSQESQSDYPKQIEQGMQSDPVVPSLNLDLLLQPYPSNSLADSGTTGSVPSSPRSQSPGGSVVDMETLAQTVETLSARGMQVVDRQEVVMQEAGTQTEPRRPAQRGQQWRVNRAEIPGFPTERAYNAYLSASQKKNRAT